jgi:hypothetical protein
MRCGARSNLLVVIRAHFQRPWRSPFVNDERELEGSYYYGGRTRCFDGGKCQARRVKRQERQRTRSTMLVLAEPKAPDAPRGTCRWCGEPIELTDDAPRGSAARQTHRGDEFEKGDQDCQHKWWRSRTNDARTALQYRGDPCCVDCGSEAMWEADHEIALEDGGDHTLENLKRRCLECHRKKTGRENTARARARREDRSGQESLAL